MRILLSLTLLSLSFSLPAQNLNIKNLFKNRYFTLSQNADLLCATSEESFFPQSKLIKIIEYYESGNLELRQQAVQLLTNHKDKEHLQRLTEIKLDCIDDKTPQLCILSEYWENHESALRVLALFYDTKTIIKHNDKFSFKRFSVDHIRSFEKAIRKIPPFLREKITRAKPIRNLQTFIKDIDPEKQTQILNAFPTDTETRVWIDDTHPLSIIPGKGFMSEVVAQVFNGRNSIIFTLKGFDKAKDGQIYRDIGIKYLVDFRLPLIIHELAHVIDNFYFWNGQDDLYYFYRYRKMSTDDRIYQNITDSRLALWPSKWFEAFEYLWEVHQGRYDGTSEEKLAELISQYIFIPRLLSFSSPTTYMWLRDVVFKGIEYQGYSQCPNQITRQLAWWETAVAVQLGR